ncbi:13685_t:CDS:2 [Ambispora gerdemannii]|uniref:13685_t:CDS:1 n=1 Tax=Ambispora gerdemannii TaxID=144530 RepID=A0A9N9A7X5_9GLOM|nr:13685_t:CDS:2 [Ambispora gerdemannii]
MVTRNTLKRSLLKDKAKTTPQFREAFTGPTCLYKFLSERPQRFLTRNLTYMVQARKKRPISGKIEMHQHISLNDLYNRRVKEEQQSLNSRVWRSLRVTIDRLALPERYKQEPEFVWQVFLCRILENQPSNNNKESTSKKRKLDNGEVDSSNYHLVHITSLSVSPDTELFTEKKSFEISETNFEIDESLKDLVLYMSLNSKGCENPASSGNQNQALIQNEDILPNPSNSSENTRILWIPINLLVNGQFIKDGNYERDAQVAYGKDEVIRSLCRIKLSLNWDYKVQLPMKSSKLLASTTTKSYRSCVKSEEEVLPVTFIFRVVDCDMKQMVRGFICPWCNNDYLDSRTLFYHLANNHVHLKFGTKNGKNIPSERIIVTVVNEEHSDLEYFSLVKSEGVLRPKSFAFPRIQNSKSIQLPLTNFYHSQSFMPFTADDSDGDSDEEMCTHWIQQTSDENLDELPELNNSEKLLMKMWNRHIEPYRGLGDCHLSEVCLLFAKNRATEIASFNLRNNFVLHLMTLAQYQMIDVTCTTRCLGYVDRAIDSLGGK